MSGSFKVYPLDTSTKTIWQDYFDRLAYKNVYSTPDYVEFLAWHYGDEAELVVYEDGDDFIYYPYFKKNLSKLDFASTSQMDLDGRYHIHSSWYYGGPLASGPAVDTRLAEGFFRCFCEYAIEQGFVSEFIRFDANVKNHCLYPTDEVAFDRETVFVDLTKERDDIWRDFNQSNRWAVKRAQRDGVRINIRGPDETEYWHRFAEIYHSEMVRKNAPAHLYFDRSFFDRLRADLAEHLVLVTSSLDGEMCGAVILIFGDIHSFGYLSATEPRFWPSQVNNLAWTESIWWSKEQGFHRFDLMGGRPGVFKYKSHFSKSRGQFYVRKAVYDSACYQALCDANNRPADDLATHFPSYL